MGVVNCFYLKDVGFHFIKGYQMSHQSKIALGCLLKGLFTKLRSEGTKILRTFSVYRSSLTYNRVMFQ